MANSPNLQLFQSFPTEVAQNDLEWAILPDSQLFQSFPTKVALNGKFCKKKQRKGKHYDTANSTKKKKHYDTANSAKKKKKKKKPLRYKGISVKDYNSPWTAVP